MGVVLWSIVEGSGVDFGKKMKRAGVSVTEGLGFRSPARVVIG